MTTIEQILLKLGIDQSQVEPGLQSFQQKVGQASDKGHKSFLHVGSAGRKLHKILEDINGVVPGLGSAFQFALNPVVGLLSGIALAFAMVKRHISETEAALDKIGEAAARSRWLDVAEAAHSAQIEAAKKTGRTGAATAGQIEAELARQNVQEAKKAVQEAEEEYQKLQKQYPNVFEPLIGAGGVNLGYKGDERPRQLLETAKAKLAAARGTLSGAFGRLEKTAAQEGQEALGEKETEAFLKKAERAIEEEMQKKKELGTVEAQLSQAELAAQREKMDNEERLRSLIEEKLKLRRDLESKDDDEIEAAKEKLEIARLDREIIRTSKDIQREKAAATKEEADNRARAEALGFQHQIAQQHELAPYQPTLDELAGSRTWTPWARQARYVEWLEAGAKQQILMGNIAGATETIRGKGGIRELREQLEAGGFIKPEISMEKMQEHLALLSRKAVGEGLNVAVQNCE